MGISGIQITKLNQSSKNCNLVMIYVTILGLNEYLTSAVPSMHRMTRSNLIEMKTMQWMNHLPKDQFETVVDYAVKRRKDIVRQYQEGQK